MPLFFRLPGAGLTVLIPLFRLLCEAPFPSPIYFQHPPSYSSLVLIAESGGNRADWLQTGVRMGKGLAECCGALVARSECDGLRRGLLEGRKADAGVLRRCERLNGGEGGCEVTRGEGAEWY